jgi:hypothetical protein
VTTFYAGMKKFACMWLLLEEHKDIKLKSKNLEDYGSEKYYKEK